MMMLPVVDLAPGDRVWACWHLGLQIWRMGNPIVVEGLESDGTAWYYDRSGRVIIKQRFTKERYPPGIKLEVERLAKR